MADTFTSNAKIRKPANNDGSWDVLLNANFDLLDALAAIGGGAVATTEVPSTTLNVAVAAVTFINRAGAFVAYAGAASQAMTASNTNYLYLTDAGALVTNTTGFPASTNIVPLAIVVAGTASITSITDARRPFRSAGGASADLPLAGGTMTDGANIAVGTTTGTKLGTATTQKLGLWGVTPIVQPASANQAALGTLATVNLTDSTTGTASTTIADVGASFSQAGLNNIHASLLAQINHAVSDFAAVKTLLNQLRSDLVAAGILKGSA